MAYLRDTLAVIAWVRKGVCGWYSLNCCCKVCMCVGGGEGGSVGVGVIAWVRKGVCGWYSRNCCCKVCV